MSMSSILIMKGYRQACVLVLLCLILLLCLIPVIPLRGRAEQLTAEEILAELNKRMNLDEGSYILDFIMTSYEGEESHRAEVRVYLYDEERSIATFLSPERMVNDHYLVIGHNTWMYQEGLHRPIRISPRQKLFGDAGIAETVGINYYREYDVVKLSEDNGYYVLELKARDKKTAYQLATLQVTRGELRLTRIILKALNGQELKELIYDNHRQLAGHEVADITIKNLLHEKDKKTELVYRDIRRKELPEKAFQPLMLDKFRLLIKD